VHGSNLKRIARRSYWYIGTDLKIEFQIKKNHAGLEPETTNKTCKMVFLTGRDLA